MLRATGFIFILIIVAGCGQVSVSEKINEQAGETKSSNVFSKKDIAKFTMSAIMNQSPEIISVNQNGDLYFVSYHRESDNQKFEYKIKL